MAIKYRIKALDYRIRPIYIFDDLDGAILYGQNKAAIKNEFDVHRQNENGRWILEFCSYEQKKHQLKVIKNLLKVTYDKKPFYKEMEKIFGKSKTLQHFPNMGIKESNVIVIREADSFVFDKLKKYKIKEKYFIQVEPITKKLFKCHLNDSFRQKTELSSLTIEDLER